MKIAPKIGVAFALLAGIGFVVSFTHTGAQAQGAPRYYFDPGWPKELPNKWKIGGVTGLAVDKNDDIWVLNRPNDLTDIELHAELTPPAADCCVARSSARSMHRKATGWTWTVRGSSTSGRTRSANTTRRRARWWVKYHAFPRPKAEDLREAAAPNRTFQDGGDAARWWDSSAAGVEAPVKAPRAAGMQLHSAPSILPLLR